MFNVETITKAGCVGVAGFICVICFMAVCDKKVPVKTKAVIVGCGMAIMALTLSI